MIFDTYLNKIKSSRYGRDMRDPIYNFLTDLYNRTPIHKSTDSEAATIIEEAELTVNGIRSIVENGSEYFTPNQNVVVHSNKIGYFGVGYANSTGEYIDFKTYLKKKFVDSKSYGPTYDNQTEVTGIFRVFKHYDSFNANDTTDIGVGRELELVFARTTADTNWVTLRFKITDSGAVLDPGSPYLLHSKNNAKIVITIPNI